MKRNLVVLLLALVWPAYANAQLNAWGFDFDPNIAADPAHVNKHIDELKVGLPGQPTDADVVEVTTGPVTLYFFQDVLTMLNGARDSEPAPLPPVTRTPSICVVHASFTKPNLGTGGNFLCEASEAAILGLFAQKMVNTCLHVEFPESYVYDHEPIGFVDVPMVSNWSTLISLIGEALTHVNYPKNLMPADFIPRMRTVLARLRYAELSAQIADRTAAYRAAVAKLHTDAACYDQASSTAFIAQINAMLAELSAVEQQLDAIYQAGVTQAAADRKAVENQGRIRATLPYPALTDRDRELLAFYVGAVTWRIRGGGLLSIDVHQSLLRRSLYVQYPFHLIAELSGGADDARDIGFLTFIDAGWGYKEWFDMGTSPGNDKYSDLVEMTKRGKRLSSLTAPLLQDRGFDVRPLISGSLQMGPCYYYIWEELYALTPGLVGFFLGADMHDWTKYEEHLYTFIEQPISAGEPCTGGALALGMTRTYLWGKSGGVVCNPDCVGKPCGADDGCGTPCGGEDCPAPDSSVPPPLDDAGYPIDAGAQSDTAPPAYSEAGTVIAPPAEPSSGCSYPTSHGHNAANGLPLFLLLALLYVRRRA